MSDAERAIREKYLSDTTTSPRYNPDVAYVPLPHQIVPSIGGHPRPYVGMGPANNPMRPWLFPPRIPSTPPLIRSTPSTSTESTHIYRMPQPHTGANAVTAAAAANHRKIYDISMNHSTLDSISNHANKHMSHESIAQANPVIPSDLASRTHASSTGNSISGRYQLSTSSSSFPLDHQPHYVPKCSPPLKHRRVQSPNVAIPHKEDHTMSYYGPNETRDPYLHLPIAKNQRQLQFDVFSQYKGHPFKEDLSKPIASQALPDDGRSLPDRLIRSSLPPPAIPIFPQKGMSHHQVKSNFSISRDEDVFTSPSPIHSKSSPPASLPSPFLTVQPPNSVHSSALESQISLNIRSSKSSSPHHPYDNVSLPVQTSSFVRKRHHSDENEERNEKNSVVNIPVKLDSISNPYSRYGVNRKETDPSTHHLNNIVNDPQMTTEDMEDEREGKIEEMSKAISYNASNSKLKVHQNPAWREKKNLLVSEEDRGLERAENEGMYLNSAYQFSC